MSDNCFELRTRLEILLDQMRKHGPAAKRKPYSDDDLWAEIRAEERGEQIAAHIFAERLEKILRE